MDITKKGDFLLIETGYRHLLSPTYQVMTVTGSTLDRNDLLLLATNMKQNRKGPSTQNEVTDITEAVSVVEGGGWIVLEFLN